MFVGFEMRKSVCSLLVILPVDCFRTNARLGSDCDGLDVVVGSLKKLFNVKLRIAEELLHMILVFRIRQSLDELFGQVSKGCCCLDC